MRVLKSSQHRSIWLLAAAGIALALTAGALRSGAASAETPAPGLAEVNRTIDIGNGLTMDVHAIIDTRRVSAEAALDQLLPAAVEPASVTAAYAVNRRWSAADIPVRVAYNPAFDPPGVNGRPVVQWAMSQWNGVSGQAFRFADAGLTDAYADADCLLSDSDGLNTVRFTHFLPFGVLGSTCTLSSRASIDGLPRVVEFDTQFDAYSDWSAADITPHFDYDLKSTVLHELGHALGLGHSNVPGATMLPELDFGQQLRTITADDASGIRYLYPVSVPTVTATPTATATPTRPPALPTAVATATPIAIPRGGLTFRLSVPVVASDSQADPPATVPPVVIPTTPPTSAPPATSTPTSTPAPGGALSESAIAAIVRTIPAPAGSGLPGDINVNLYPGGIDPISVHETMDDAAFLTILGVPNVTLATYGKQVLTAIRTASPAMPGASYLYLTIWSDHEWYTYPSFLTGTTYSACTLTPAQKWRCYYPEFSVRLRLSTGAVQFEDTPWSNSDYWQNLN